MPGAAPLTAVATSLVTLLVVPACGSPLPDHEHAGGAAGSSHGGTVGTGGSSATGGGAPAEPIVVGPSSGHVAVPFSFSAIGSGSGSVGTIDLTGGAGTVEVGGQTLAAVTYERQPFKSYFLYQVLAVAPDRWFVLWLYCLGGQLQGVYYEGTDGTVMATEGATGACAEDPAPSTPQADLPAVSMPYPELVDGFSIAGDDIGFAAAAPGSVRVSGHDYVLLPFGEVDCSLCGTPGWWELHSLLWDGARACFAILYLVDGKGTVQLDYVLCLPGLDDPIGAPQLPATWAHDPAG